MIVTATVSARVVFGSSLGKMVCPFLDLEFLRIYVEFVRIILRCLLFFVCGKIRI